MNVYFYLTTLSGGYGGYYDGYHLADMRTTGQDNCGCNYLPGYWSDDRNTFYPNYGGGYGGGGDGNLSNPGEDEEEESCSECLQDIDECYCMTMSLTADKHEIDLGDDYTMTLNASFKNNAQRITRINIYTKSLTRSTNYTIVDDYGIPVSETVIQEYNDVARTPGGFTPLADVYFENGTTKQVEGPNITVQFPDVQTIVADPTVKQKMEEMWTQTKNAAGLDENGAYEQEFGVWIYYNTQTLQYEFSGVIASNVARNGSTTSITPSYPYEDMPLMPIGGRYRLAWFHTHPPMYYHSSTQARGVGISPKDENGDGDEAVAEFFELPVIAYDYVATDIYEGEPIIYGGHPLNAAMTTYFSNSYNRRPLP
jgi:hypothetical protein